MSSGFFALMSRMRNISRWNLMRNTFNDNVQEHSHMVAILAHALAVIRRDVLGLPADPERAAVAGLYHDAPEILTGDMPTPVKYYNPEIMQAYKQVERVSADRLISLLPQAMQPVYREAFDMPDPETRALMKAADKLAGYIKCVEELRAGNMEFKKAGDQTLEALNAMGRPEVDYFLTEFLPAFSVTLDEISL